jgi:hypothetical protein
MPKFIDVHSGFVGITQDQLSAAHQRDLDIQAAKDAAALAATLADGVDFQALTPGRHWQATSPRQVAEETVLGT